jgi:transposase
MRFIGLDVHQGFCEVAVREDGKTRSAGRVATNRGALELFAGSLSPSDEVALEATGPAMAIARIVEPHVARVVVANAQDVRAISHARVKSDRFDARTLAELLAAGMLAPVWVPDAETQGLRRRLARRAALVRQRTRAKNEIHATLARCLLGHSPVTDLFGKQGRAWLAEQQLSTEEEAETVAGCLRQIEFLDGEVAAIDKKLAQWAASSQDARRLMSIPGVGAGVAVTLMAAIGDVSRFSSAHQLVAYLGLDPKVRQSGEEAPRHGRISKRGNSQARTVLVEAAWAALRQPGPLRAFGERIRARKGAQVAAVAVARKLACLAWQLLTKGEDYAYARPSNLRRKLREVELDAGMPPLPTRHAGQRISASAAERAAEHELVEHAETAYRRLIADWKASGPAKKRGAGATHGDASSRPSNRQAARQAQAPTPAL